MANSKYSEKIVYLIVGMLLEVGVGGWIFFESTELFMKVASAILVVLGLVIGIGWVVLEVRERRSQRSHED